MDKPISAQVTDTDNADSSLGDEFRNLLSLTEIFEEDTKVDYRPPKWARVVTVIIICEVFSFSVAPPLNLAGYMEMVIYVLEANLLCSILGYLYHGQ